MDLLKLDELLKVSSNHPTKWIDVCDFIAHAFGGIGAAIFPIDKTTRLPWPLHSSSLKEVTRTYIKDKWYLNDIRERGLAKARIKGFTIDTDFIAESEMCQTPFYRDFLHLHGIGGFIAILFKVERADWVISIQLPLGVSEPNFEFIRIIPEIKERLEAAAHASIINSQMRLNGLVADLTTLQQGIVLFDVNSNVIFKSDLAKELLARSEFNLNKSRFPSYSIKEKVKEVLNSFNHGVAISQIHALSRGEKLDLFCRISTIPEDLRIFNSVAVSMMVLLEAKSFSSHLLELLVDSYGLTKTERRLTVKLFEAHKLKDIAVLMNISEGNARQHLKKIFRKIEVGSQSELIIKIMRECTLIKENE